MLRRYRAICSEDAYARSCWPLYAVATAPGADASAPLQSATEMSAWSPSPPPPPPPRGFIMLTRHAFWHTSDATLREMPADASAVMRSVIRVSSLSRVTFLVTGSSEFSFPARSLLQPLPLFLQAHLSRRHAEPFLTPYRHALPCCCTSHV